MKKLQDVKTLYYYRTGFVQNLAKAVAQSGDYLSAQS